MDMNDGLTIARLRSLSSLSNSWTARARQMLDGKQLATARRYMRRVEEAQLPVADAHGIPVRLLMLSTAELFAEKVDPDINILIAISLAPYVRAGVFPVEEVMRDWGEDVAWLVKTLLHVKSYSTIGLNADQDNFRGLLLSLAADIRVIIIMIVENLALMRMINLHPDDDWVRSVAFEANCLYAQLAHRLGLYAIKGELEDLSLKYTNREVYKRIAARLHETKRARDEYIRQFIEPVRRELTAAGLRFEIKGRTKSISSIWAKIKKQKVDLDGIFDLFAIRVIIDTPREREKRDCWLAYSILADMYTANPSRMKDWISLPKSNGYESLHATVMGPGNKWVEVQFRSRRMDLVAEKGLAAHWRYKGGHGDTSDQWMNNIRDILESGDEGAMQLMKGMRLDNYAKEVFAFTPKGALLRLPKGATVLDFAFAIHSGVGSRCVGAIVNGRHEKINYKVQNGDLIEIVTSSTQTPKQDWLATVVTSKARNKIRQSLNESRVRKAQLGKETLERRARNRKLEYDEALLMHLIKKRGYKMVNDFYADIHDEKVDPGRFLGDYVAAAARQKAEEAHRVSAEEFKIVNAPETDDRDIITIGDRSLRGMNYRFARCCNPIHGDDVFGFISSDGLVKIHKSDCPNAGNIRRRYPYRLIRVRWSDTEGASTLRPVTLRIIGTDDIGIVTNLTSIISKDPDTQLRNISISSDDGIFQGRLVLGVSGNQSLKMLVKKLKGVKGVKDVTRC